LRVGLRGPGIGSPVEASRQQQQETVGSPRMVFF
jgi:hypothetical protein